MNYQTMEVEIHRTQIHLKFQFISNPVYFQWKKKRQKRKKKIKKLGKTRFYFNKNIYFS